MLPTAAQNTGPVPSLAKVCPSSPAEPSPQPRGIQPAWRPQTPDRVANLLNFRLLLSFDGFNEKGKSRDVRRMLADNWPPLFPFLGR